MKSVSALIAGGGASILAASIVLLGIAPAAEALFTPQPEPTAIETPGATDTSAPGEAVEPRPTEEAALSCEELVAAKDRPPIFDSPRVAQKWSEDAVEFEGILGERGSAIHDLTVAPEVNVSEYFARLGCAPEGSRWAVVTLSDQYSLKVSDGRNGASYDTVLDLDASTVTLTSLTGTKYQPVEVFVTGPAGLHAVVFEIPEDVTKGVFTGTFVWDSTLRLYYGDADLPETVSFERTITPVPFALGERWGCAVVGEEWC